MARKQFVKDQFHDSFLLSFDFADWQEKISAILWCPRAGEAWEEGRYLQIIFRRVLFFGFEAAALGEFGDQGLMVSDLVLEHESQETQIWRRRLEELARPSRHSPKGMRSRRYTELYHFIFDSGEFAGLAFLHGQDGFQIMCRDFDIQDVTHQMPGDAQRYDPAPIKAE